MDITEGIVIAIIVIIIVWFMNECMNKGNYYQAKEKKWLCTDQSTGDMTEVMMKKYEKDKNKAKENYETAGQYMLAQNRQYYGLLGDVGTTDDLLDCVCDGGPYNFGKWDYGAGGINSYQQFVTSQGVDNKVIENHLMYVRDRKALNDGSDFITGRTYSPDSHDSYDPIPWVGIRGRHQAVPQINPTQVPDLDTSLYYKNRPYCIWT